MDIEEKLCIKAALKGIPLTASFELTPLCNLKCSMCYIRHSKKEQMEVQRLRTVEEWICIAEQLKKMGTLFILLTGGEPLLYPEFTLLYKELTAMGFIITINTNGTLIDNEIGKLFSEIKPRRVNVTLYGASYDTYEKVTMHGEGYEKALKGINILIDNNVQVKLNCSMIEDNKADTDKILDIADRFNVPIEYNTYMFPCSKNKNHSFCESVRVSPEEAATYSVYIKKREKKEKYKDSRNKALDLYYNEKELEKMDRHMKCRAGKSSCWFNWKGEMTPCVFMDNPSVNVMEVPVASAWDEIRHLSLDILMPDKCVSCKHRAYCNICGAVSIWEKSDYLCEYMDKTIEILEEEIRKESTYELTEH